ncbi:MAG TPA: glutathione peroxidase [Gammaproteobacteria bacterium]|nr:glutathione peroxidase [Gammaproteobacteria bacterium]
MQFTPRSLCACILATLASFIPGIAMADCPPVLDFSKRQLAGKEPVNLCDAYAGKVLLVVNTASRCGFTPQFEALEALHQRLEQRGFAVLGFPSNDFWGQDPGTEEEIAEFCRMTYGVKFPMFEKTHAAEAKADPFYRALAAAAGEYPQWNFHKYLIDRSGKVVGSFGSRTRPDDPALLKQIEALLGQ